MTFELNKWDSPSEKWRKVCFKQKTRNNMSVISGLGQETVFGDVTDSERLEHREIRLGVLGDEADSWLEADFKERARGAKMWF